MPYAHYGNIGDIWKHLPLCSFLINERPRKHVETNSAFPIYTLEKTPNQQYGVYTFFEKAATLPALAQTPYYQHIAKANAGKGELNTYLGSSGLAMKCLADVSEEFVLFDLEQPPLDSCSAFAQQQGLASKVKVFQQNSIEGAFTLLPQLSSQDFIHFDPYEMWQRNNDRDYGDVFAEATKRGVKCMVWYGFYTMQQKKEVYNFFAQKLSLISPQDHNVQCVEIIMDIIQEDNIIANPGIIGAGVLTSNLSQQSRADLTTLADELVQAYKDTSFQGHSGGLHKEKVSWG